MSDHFPRGTCKRSGVSHDVEQKLCWVTKEERKKDCQHRNNNNVSVVLKNTKDTTSTTFQTKSTSVQSVQTVKDSNGSVPDPWGRVLAQLGVNSYDRNPISRVSVN